MTSRRQQITLKPEVLRWARERADLSQERLAEKMNVKPERVKEWETAGELSIAQADRLAARTYTPLGYLYLSKPPEEPLPIRDFRTRGDGPPRRPSVNLLDTVYQMQRRQNWMRDDLIQNGEQPLPFVGTFSRSDSHTEVAAAMRATLGLGAGWAKGVYTWQDALRFLRNKLDEVGVLVVFNGVVGNNTSRQLDPSEFQGFSLVDEYAPLVFVNSADYIAAQIFTLAHEVAHLFIGETGLTAFDSLIPPYNETERFCDRVAAEFLVPEMEFDEAWPQVQDSDNPFAALARQFKVSTIVAARRAFDLKKTSRSDFLEFYKTVMQPVKGGRHTGEGGHFWNIQRWCIGPRFAGAVARAAKEGRLLYREAYGLTDLRGDTFEQMPEKMEIAL